MITTVQGLKGTLEQLRKLRTWLKKDLHVDLETEHWLDQCEDMELSLVAAIEKEAAK